jgi:hypothetical protein
LLLDQKVYGNTGQGWRLLSSNARHGGGGLTGFAGGPLIRYGTSTARCGIEFVERDGSSDTCSGALADTRHVSVIGKLAAFAAHGDEIYSFDGKFWTHWYSLGGPWIEQLWASDRTLLLATSEGAYVSRDGGAPQREMLPSSAEPDAAAQMYSAAWGFPDDELWVANSAGELFRRDENGWSLAWRKPAAGDCAAVTALWGARGQVFALTRSGLHRIRDARAEALIANTCDPDSSARLWSVWGNSPAEVFVVQQLSRPGACGDIAVSWFDGSVMSPL